MKLTRALKALLLFVSGLILEPLVSSFVAGPILPVSRIVISLTIAAVISAPVYIPMFRAAMTEAAVERLNAISLNPWIWVTLIAITFAYLAAFPISNYFAQRVAFQTVARTKVLSAEERHGYETHINDLQRMLNGYYSSYEDDKKKLENVSDKLNAQVKTLTDNLAQSNAAKADWQQNYNELVGKFTNSDFAQKLIQAQNRLETAKQDVVAKDAALKAYQALWEKHLVPHSPMSTAEASMSAHQGLLEAQKNLDQLKSQFHSNIVCR